MTRAEERRLLKKFRKMIVENKRLTTEAQSMKRKIDRLMKKKLRKVI